MAVTYYLSPVSLIIQYLTNLGIVAQGAQLFTYLAGTVSTPATTYTDSTGTVANANPMTLNGAGRPAAASGAPVAFWVAGGVTVKLIVNDALGNLLVQLDNLPAINDLTNSTNSLATTLASAASSNLGLAGPVAGADLVANAVKSYDVFASVRAANVPILVSGQTLNIAVQGGITVRDGQGGTFYWDPLSTSTDNARTILKPTGATGAGRWLRYDALNAARSVLKTSDQSIASSTVLTLDTQLTTTLQPGTYLVQGRLALLGVGGTGQGYKVQSNFGGSVSGVTAGTGITTANGTNAAVGAVLGVAVTAGALSSTTGDAYNFDQLIIVTVAGAYQILFAQNSSSANATVMKAGSCLLVTRVA